VLAAFALRSFHHLNPFLSLVATGERSLGREARAACGAVPLPIGRSWKEQFQASRRSADTTCCDS